MRQEAFPEDSENTQIESYEWPLSFLPADEMIVHDKTSPQEVAILKFSHRRNVHHPFLLKL